MKDTTTWTASQWLDVNLGSAPTVFEGSPTQIQRLYRRLARRWHPDHNPSPQAHDVFVHLKALYARALALAGAPAARLHHAGGGPRPSPVGPVVVLDGDGRRFRFAPQASEPFELGRFYRGRSSLAFGVDPDHAVLFQQAVATVKGLRFADRTMAEQMQPLLPDLHAAPWGPQGGLWVLRRDPEAVRLLDAHHHFTRDGGRWSAEHVAWIVSGLLHLLCYLEYAGVAHQGIGLDTVWVSPATHRVHLWGGWFYARAFGQPVTVLPATSAAMAPSGYLAAKTAGGGLDRELVRAVGRELLGDRHGQRLPTDAAPAPFLHALRLPAGPSAVADYRAWKRVLTASFGPAKFVPMTLSSSTLYP